MLRSLTPALAALLALAATPTSAQTPTPTLDGAIRFMELALQEHTYSCGSPCGYKSYTIQKVAREAPCVISISATSKYDPSIMLFLNFARVTEVRSGSGSVSVMFPGGEAMLIVNSSEFAARIAYAANFARLKCDRTASTGF